MDMDPPDDLSSDEILLIEDIADVIARRGKEFEAWIKERRRDNPQYAFLYEGPGHTYFEYCVRKQSRTRAAEDTKRGEESSEESEEDTRRANQKDYDERPHDEDDDDVEYEVAESDV
jgi:hypothetical protein